MQHVYLIEASAPIKIHAHTTIYSTSYIQYFSKTLFYQYQSLYIAPAVNDFWEQQRSMPWNERSGKEVQFSVDGQNNPPGHSAQHCTYSLADMNDKAIL